MAETIRILMYVVMPVMLLAVGFYMGWMEPTKCQDVVGCVENGGFKLFLYGVGVMGVMFSLGVQRKINLNNKWRLYTIVLQILAISILTYYFKEILINLNSQIDELTTQNHPKQYSTALHKFQNSTAYQRHFIESYRNIMKITVHDPRQNTQLTLQEFVEQNIISKKTLSNNAMFMNQLLQRQGEAFEQAIANKVSLPGQVMKRNLAEPFVQIMRFIELAWVVNLALISVSFVMIVFSVSKPECSRYIPIILLAYSVILIIYSQLISGTIAISKSKDLKLQPPVSLLQAGRQLKCNTNFNQNAYKWYFSLEAERAARLFFRLQKLQRDVHQPLNFSSFQDYDCNYMIKLSDNECEPGQAKCRGVLDLPFTCRLNGYEKIKNALAQVHKVLSSIRQVLLENDEFLNGIDGGSLWDCDKKLMEKKNLLLRTGKEAGSKGFQLALILWTLSIWSAGSWQFDQKPKQQ